MKKTDINVLIVSDGIRYFCTSKNGMPLKISDDIRKKAMDVVAKHLHEMAEEITGLIQTSDCTFMPNFYRVSPN